MARALLVRLRPVSPWRIGPPNGARDRCDEILHSDALFSAICAAAAQLGWLEDWLDETVRAVSPAVRLSSGFPFLEETLFAPPPAALWPPSESGKVRWKSARYVPLPVVERLVAGQPLDEEGWVVDSHNGCLLRLDRFGQATGPFRMLTRRAAAVDRITGASGGAHEIACLQFAPGAGVWFAAVFADEGAAQRWSWPLESALRLLADSGVGGGRALGFGRAAAPQVDAGDFPALLSKRLASVNASETRAWWLLSLYIPGSTDAIDWAQADHQNIERGGRIESPAGWGVAKRHQRMVREGSLLHATAEPIGCAHDVAPAGFAHPVYRAGFAVSVPIPLRGGA